MIEAALSRRSRTCRLCGTALPRPFLDLGRIPLVNAYQAAEGSGDEARYPLRVSVCAECHLVQLDAVPAPEELFRDYAYFSSYSDSWLQHAGEYARRMIDGLALGTRHCVVEIASNDGYLLRFFVERGVPVLGVEPALNVAAAARRAGVPTITKFFGSATACALVADGVRADLVIANNVLGHVPEPDDVMAGIATVLAPDGLCTIEVPHVLRLIEGRQFDTIYHEHASYFSLAVLVRLAARHGLRLCDVEELETHGGSLRVFLRHEDRAPPPSAAVEDLLIAEEQAGLTNSERYLAFAAVVETVKEALLGFLRAARDRGEKVVGYGAPAKAAVLLNYCDVDVDLLAFTVDRSPCKQGRFVPGTRIPILEPSCIETARPEYVLILPWNIKREIMVQMAGIRRWGGRFVVPIPEVEVS